ncbi:hypothetical protein ACHAXN_008823 [Cyclotella atomus]
MLKNICGEKKVALNQAGEIDASLRWVCRGSGNKGLELTILVLTALMIMPTIAMTRLSFRRCQREVALVARGKRLRRVISLSNDEKIPRAIKIISAAAGPLRIVCDVECIKGDQGAPALHADSLYESIESFAVNDAPHSQYPSPNKKGPQG